MEQPQYIDPMAEDTVSQSSDSDTESIDGDDELGPNYWDVYGYGGVNGGSLIDPLETTGEWCPICRGDHYVVEPQYDFDVAPDALLLTGG